MFIGIKYDVYSNDSVYTKNENLNTLIEKMNLNLMLPVACIYDYGNNRFVQLHDAYKRHIEILLITIETNR
jgi:hypothetical protein